MKSITARITSTTDVIIRTEEEGHTLDQQLIAVNWFDTKIEWLYHLYNFLAARSVLKIGGKPLFKGKVSEDLGSDDGKRSILLIVSYPNGKAFKSLLESTYFKIVSLLRINAVKRFTFSFTNAVVPPNFNVEKNHYSIHHFEQSVDLKSITQLHDEDKSGICIMYAGYSYAYLNRKSKGENEIRLPTIIDNIIIYGSDKEESLRAMSESTDYRIQFENKTLGYLGIMERIF